MNIVNDFKSNLPEQSTGLDLSSRSEAPLKKKVSRAKKEKKKVKKKRKKKVKHLLAQLSKLLLLVAVFTQQPG